MEVLRVTHNSLPFASLLADDYSLSPTEYHFLAAFRLNNWWAARPVLQDVAYYKGKRQPRRLGWRI